jgi:hypothetical protein
VKRKRERQRERYFVFLSFSPREPRGRGSPLLAASLYNAPNLFLSISCVGKPTESEIKAKDREKRGRADAPWVKEGRLFLFLFELWKQTFRLLFNNTERNRETSSEVTGRSAAAEEKMGKEMKKRRDREHREKTKGGLQFFNSPLDLSLSLRHCLS